MDEQTKEMLDFLAKYYNDPDPSPEDIKLAVKYCAGVIYAFFHLGNLAEPGEDERQQ